MYSTLLHFLLVLKHLNKNDYESSENAVSIDEHEFVAETFGQFPGHWIFGIIDSETSGKKKVNALYSAWNSKQWMNLDPTRSVTDTMKTKHDKNQTNATKI